MATTLYLRSAAPAAFPTAGKQSVALPVGTQSGTPVPQSLSLVAGAAQTSNSWSSLAQTADQDNYAGRFTAPSLDQQTVSANTWTVGIGVAEGNTNAKAFLCLSLYIWRPSVFGSVVGFIYDSHASLGAEWAISTTTPTAQVVTFAGAAVTAQVGDLLVLEVWQHAIQTMATSYVNNCFFEGATKVTAGQTSNCASYLETPQDLLFGGQFPPWPPHTLPLVRM